MRSFSSPGIKKEINKKNNKKNNKLINSLQEPTQSSEKEAPATIKERFEKNIFQLAEYLVSTESKLDESKKNILLTQLDCHQKGAPGRNDMIAAKIELWIKKDDDVLVVLLENFEKNCIENPITNNEEQVIKILQEKHNIHATKRIKILGRDKMEHAIQKDQASTKLRLADKFDLDWAKEVIHYLIENMNTQNNDHFLLKPDNNAFYYGADEGQRLCVQAAKYINSDLLKEIKEINNINKDNDKEITRLANNLLAAVKQEMNSQEKESWKCVSNYWLAGDMQKGLGLTGERHQGRSHREKWEKESQQALQDVTTNENQIIDLSCNTIGDDEKARQLFIHNFRASQVSAKKNWITDVNREDYQHKPGSKNEQHLSDHVDEDLICRRMCKWILHVTHYNDQPVVYALDKLALDPIARGEIFKIEDNISQSGEIKLKVPVCTSELREIFRNIDKFETNISYYKQLKKTNAPWEAGNTPSLLQDWAEYAMHLTRSLLIQYPGDTLCLNGAKKMLAAWANNEWDVVIAAYKTIKPSELYQPVLPSKQKHTKNHEARVKQAKKVLDKTTADAVVQTAEELTDCIVKKSKALSNKI